MSQLTATGGAVWRRRDGGYRRQRELAWADVTRSGRFSAARRIAGSQCIVMASVDTDGTDGPGHQFADHDQDVPVLDGGLVDGYSLDEITAGGL